MTQQTAIRPAGASAVDLFAPRGATSPAAQAAATGTAQVQRPKSKLWANVGRKIVTTDANGVEVVDFVAMPSNLAIDTMAKREYPWLFDMKGNRREYTKPLTEAQVVLKEAIDLSNALWDMVNGFGMDSLEPGQSVELEGFTIVLSRVDDRVATAPQELPGTADKLAAMRGLMGGLAPKTDTAG